jgi:hypothetical protein
MRRILTNGCSRTSASLRRGTRICSLLLIGGARGQELIAFNLGKGKREGRALPTITAASICRPTYNHMVDEYGRGFEAGAELDGVPNVRYATREIHNNPHAQPDGVNLARRAGRPRRPGGRQGHRAKTATTRAVRRISTGWI